MSTLTTERLDLTPVSLPLLEAVIRGDRLEAEAISGARFPDAWPGRALVERAFSSPLDRLREDPEAFLWGTRLMVTRGQEERVVVGSVVLNGRPDATGTVEIGYGVEGRSQGQGYATEGSRAVLHWTLQQASVRRVIATTPAWHRASLRVIEKLGMRRAGTLDHDLLGELLVFERFRE
ncbi:GNAT family N-acetyltransferase [Sorangium sp. So ce260]|uniref:GNAT family N-acetyltransferase n=1 Tax=Sorangium sp. So ce260 TaxID=3133291 RepID=UPI003F644F77